MPNRLYNYIILPQQVSILFEKYKNFTHDVVDSYIYLCDVYNDGFMKKTNYICVKIKKKGNSTIQCNHMELTLFLNNKENIL